MDAEVGRTVVWAAALLQTCILCDPCGSGFTREEGSAVNGTGFAGVRG
ncbi:hypothetical protein X970_20630 [Pseudomonas monteilii SB3101]|uniref:Uncharacterized protein n=2 Tax=Pseudomonas TaxID=286 RepID=V9V8E9_9PSED|nr:hypothetical protein X969_20995 [Pseudomonas monteilii SB3078]AHC91181.1 hypothetical protein X970_20630 [Pseudomonas monteilii SB3101]AJG11770.1 hypothetical protein RK21_00262 [Pseudomonas plecoglossicida]ESW40774.1 hypothetical protein O164_04240 [Pseudomonas taiwanensis SJ9]